MGTDIHHCGGVFRSSLQIIVNKAHRCRCKFLFNFALFANLIVCTASRTEVMVFHQPINLISMTKTTTYGSRKQPARNEFRDLFASVNGAGDKTNYKIFVNGPSNPEMHIACFCPRNKNELENLVHIFLCAVKSMTHAGSTIITFSTLSTCYRVKCEMKLME